MNPITVSVPGKIHLMGEHSVVYGKPALLAAIDKRAVVTLAPQEGKSIRIICENLQQDITLTIDQVLEKIYSAQKEWERFQKEKDPQILKAITKEPIDYVVIAIGETLLYYGKPPIHGFSLYVSSDIPIGAGLGSSAAVAVAIASAMSQFIVQEIDNEKVHEIAVLVEQKRHGNSSGSDPAASTHGNLVWFRRESEVLKVIQPVPVSLSYEIASNFYLVDTGVPEESTGQMVQAVRAIYEEKIEYVDRIFNDQEKLTRDMVIVLKNSHADNLMEIIKQGERNLEKLQVVSDFVKGLIREIEASGGVAKISGGGGKTKGTGNILVYHPTRSALDAVLRRHNLTSFSVRLGAPGLTVH